MLAIEHGLKPRCHLFQMLASNMHQNELFQIRFFKNFLGIGSSSPLSRPLPPFILGLHPPFRLRSNSQALCFHTSNRLLKCTIYLDSEIQKFSHYGEGHLLPGTPPPCRTINISQKLVRSGSSIFTTTALGFLEVELDIHLLGAPIIPCRSSHGSFPIGFFDLARRMDRFQHLKSHNALIILKSSLSTPKLLYAFISLRGSPSVEAI